MVGFLDFSMLLIMDFLVSSMLVFMIGICVSCLLFNFYKFFF